MTNVQNDQSDFLSNLQQLEFACRNGEDITPSKLADSYRGLLLHVKENNWEKSGDSTDSVAEKYLRKYEKVIDRMDELGMNNYAEGALALCNFHKNESAKWSSGLSVEKVLQMCNSKDSDSGAESDEDQVITLRDPVKKAASVTKGVQQLVSTKPLFKQGLSSLGSHQAHHPQEAQMDNPTVTSSNCHAYGSAPYAPFEKSHPSVASLQNPPPTAHQTTGQSIRATSESQLLGQVTHQEIKRHIPTGNIYKRSTVNNGIFGCQIADSDMVGQRDSEERLEVNPEKIGGPYANFGQKRKNPASSYSKWVPKSSRPWGCNPSEEEEEDDVRQDGSNRQIPFRTAREQYIINQHNKHGGGARDRSPPVHGANYGAVKKSLGTRRGPSSKFVPPILNRDTDGEGPQNSRRAPTESDDMEEPVDERLKGIDPKMIELINNEIMDHGAQITWEDIAGLDFAKKTIKEIVVWPMLRPDIFTGLRGPPKGLLLFGPPGTGKTLIGKCIASQSKSTFFCISASSLTSKWVGEGEKMVRALFAVARVHQPSVVFIDEIDSLLSQRSDSEHESSRRIKTEFLVQLDGAATGSEDRILVIGATNRPQEIDEAARRRFVKRLLIPLPEAVARRQIVVNLMSQQTANLTQADVDLICGKTDGYSGADMTNLCREAALGPIRSIPFEQMETITPDQVRPITVSDFEDALHQVRASVSSKDLLLYTEWNQTYGSFQ